MKFSILTLFPDFFTSPLQESILKRAIEKKQISVEMLNIRNFADNKYHSIDDKPFGGGAGMLMQAEPVALAIESVKKINEKSEVIFFTPSAPEFSQKDAYDLANTPTHKIFLCGHYEGIDERVIESHVDKSFSIGKAVVTGGEIPALMCLDAVTRLLENVISKKKSHERETFSVELYEKGEYPQFTRPEIWRKKKVPNVLLSGNHSDIEKYQFENLKNCTVLEKNCILFREKYKQDHQINKKIKLEKYSKNKNCRKKYAELLEYKADNNLNILEFTIVEKNSESDILKNIKINIEELDFTNTNFEEFNIICIEEVINNL